MIAYGSTEVNPIGLLILLCSVTIGGLNQVIVQSQLQRDGAKYLNIATMKNVDQTTRGSAENGGGSAPLPVKLNPIVFTYARNAGVATIFSSSVYRQLLASSCLQNHDPATAWAWHGCCFRWEIAPWASLAALCFTITFDLEPMLASPFLASAETFVSQYHLKY